MLLLSTLPDDYTRIVGSFKITISAMATLLGYDKVQLMSGINDQVDIMMPYLPLDTPLQCIKLEKVAPNEIHLHNKPQI